MRVVEALRRVPSHVGARLDPFRVENAILALGPPWPAGRDEIAFPLAADKAAERLREWLTQTETTVVHLCPLDYADKLPEWRFGPNEVRCLPASELDEAVAPARLRRHHVNWVFDSRRFSEFQWLVVRETRPLRPERLEVSHDLMIKPVEHDFGTVVPHMSPFTGPVEMALFALLLLPWEEVAEGKKFRWKPFRVPWVYTIKNDPFETPNRPPSPEALTWWPVVLSAPDGTIDEIDEIVQPARWDLEAAVASWTEPNDVWWNRIQVALQSDLFQTPIVHFFVRALITDDIDEFLAHICTIEAALGLNLDHDSKNRPKLPNVKRQGATERLARRCAALLCDREAHATLRRLYRGCCSMGIRNVPEVQRECA
jgi:hypothetical protein